MTFESTRRWFAAACLVMVCAGCSGAPTTPVGPPPRTAKAPASEVVVRAANGADLSPQAAGAVRATHNALVTANTDQLESLYQPQVGAPSPKTVAGELKSASARTAVAETLRTPPALEPDGDATYSYGNYGVTVTANGVISYIGNP